MMESPRTTPASDPHADSTGKLSTRGSESLEASIDSFAATADRIADELLEARAALAACHEEQTRQADHLETERVAYRMAAGRAETAEQQLAALTEERDTALKERDEEIAATQHTYRAGYDHGKAAAEADLAALRSQVSGVAEEMKTDFGGRSVTSTGDHQ